MRHPKQMEGLAGRRVRTLAIGSMHCVAVTEDGEVFAWGKNDQGQLGEGGACGGGTITEPTLVQGLEGRHIVGASCGPSQVSRRVSEYILFIGLQFVGLSTLHKYFHILYLYKCIKHITF